MLSDLWNLGGKRLPPKRGRESQVISIQVTSGTLDTSCFQLWFLAFGWVHTSRLLEIMGVLHSASWGLLNHCHPLHASAGADGRLRLLHSCHFCPIPSQISPFLSPFLISLFAESVVSMALRHCCLVVLRHSLLCGLPYLLHGLLIAGPVPSTCDFSQWH